MIGLHKRTTRRTVIFVIDALRPDLMSAENTPYLWGLMEGSIRFANSRAIFPTLTRVSTAAMGTGAAPGKNGIFGNNIYVPEIDSRCALNTGTMETMRKLSKARKGSVVKVKTMAQRFFERNLKYAVVSSGTPGGAFLLNPQAEGGCGVVINGYISQNETVAFPRSVSDEILMNYPRPQDETRAEQTYGNRVSWTEDILKDYVIEKLDPDIIVNWIAEPDHSQHYYGVGSAQAIEMVRLVDTKIGEVVNRIIQRGEFEDTNFFVLSDHGCSRCTSTIDLKHKLMAKGLKEGEYSEDTVVADNDEIAFIHVRDRDRERIKGIVGYLQGQNWTDVIFTAPKDEGELGIIDGTFSLAGIGLWNEKDGPDIVVTFPWSSAKNEFGYPGTDYEISGISGEPADAKSSHGSLSPYCIRNVMFAFGPDFKKNVTSLVPVNMLDIMATILHLYEIEGDDNVDGRIISEMFSHSDAVDPEKIPVETRPYYAESGSYKAVLMMRSAQGKRYLDTGWRMR